MPEADLFLLFASPLNRANIPYMIGGSVAAIFYGEPRLTHDVDFVIFLRASGAQRLIDIFSPENFYVPPAEVIAEELARERGQFNIIHEETGFKADFYTAGKDDLNAWGFRFKRGVLFEGESLTLAPPEYVIVRKLEYFREGGSQKHLRDIRSMLAISRDQLDIAQLNEWVLRLHLEAEWQQL